MSFQKMGPILFRSDRVLRKAMAWTVSHLTTFVIHVDKWWHVHWLQKPKHMFLIIVDHNVSNNFFENYVIG